MADVYKCLGQIASVAATVTTLYTVPASTGAIISSLIICNRDSVEHSAYVYASHGAPGPNARELILSEARIPPNGFKIVTAGICLTAADRLSALSDSALLSLNVFGVEQNPIPAASPKLLGQSQPVAATLTDLYTVPVGKSAVLSSLFVTALSSNALDFDPKRYRVAVSVGGGAIADKDYIAYDAPLPNAAGNSAYPIEGNTFAPVTGITLAAGDKVRVYGSDRLLNPGFTDIVFNLFGVEL